MRAGCLFTDDIGQSVTSIALSNDNLCVLAACLDSRARLLDKATGVLLAEYTGISAVCSYISFIILTSASYNSTEPFSLR